MSTSSYHICISVLPTCGYSLLFYNHLSFKLVGLYRPNSNTRGNNYKILNQSFHYDARKYCFSARIVNIWNSLPNDVVDVNNVNKFKARLDKFWMHQDVKFDFTADLTGIGDRSVRAICDV